MAGAKSGVLIELISPFLREKMSLAGAEHGFESPEYLALSRQYVSDPREDIKVVTDRERHYQSEVHIYFDDKPVVGIERLYKNTILIEPTTVCAAHCRWCLRGQYPIRTMKRDEIEHATRYMGSAEQRDQLKEVLITGGDPLMSLPLLRHTIEMLRAHAPNIGIIRMGSRVPFHDPDRINDAMLEMFTTFPEVRFELGVNVNHPVEFWPESIAAIKRLQAIGFRIYNQHPLLKGVNDDLDTLVKLYSLLRDTGIEAHYLFHAIPMQGTAHHRTSLSRGLELATQLSSCGEFSGRSKPRFAVLSDLGKIVLYHDSIVDRRDDSHQVLIRSGYRLEDRKRWNPSWEAPAGMVLANDGTMMTWYLDAQEDLAAQPLVARR